MKKHIHILQPDACTFLPYIEAPDVMEAFTITKGATVDERCDAVFCQTYTRQEMYEKLLETDKPVILHVNGDVWYEMRHIHFDTVLLDAVNAICAKALGVVCLSKFLADSGLRDVPGGNITYLPRGLWGVAHTPNGVEPGRFRLKETFNGENPLVMSQIGLSLPWKFAGIPLFFEAIRGLAPNARFVNVGTTRGHEELAAKWEAEFNMTFVEPVPDWPELLLTADVYVHPSLYDTWGRSVAEAMCCGLPVLAYDAGGVPELSDKILYCPPDDAAATASIFSDLMARPDDWPAMGRVLHEEARRLDAAHRNDYRDILLRLMAVL